MKHKSAQSSEKSYRKITALHTYEVLKYLFTELPKAKTLEDLERLADIIVGAEPIP